ncbi:MAG: hypothetical protein IKE74_10360 [Mogibacterium sp.]|nr:hypothetical protein [Mogibacterium sp.]
MKKTQAKDAVRNIKKRIVSYLSICLVVMLGLGGYFTTKYMGAGIDKQATDWYNRHNFKDYDMACSYGISEANLAKIRKADQVTDAEGALQTDGTVSFGGKKVNATIVSLTEEVSVPEVVEGRLPEGKNECMIGEDFAEVEKLQIGDRVRISVTGISATKEELTGQLDMDMDVDAANEGDSGAEDDGGDKEKDESPLYSTEFTITGLMNHPDYLRRKSVNTVSLPLSAYNTDVTDGLYTHCFVRIEQPDTGMFDEEYFEETASTRKALEKLAEELEVDRTNEVKAQANAEIDKKWAEAEQKLADAQAQIDAGQAELDSKLADGRNKLNDAQKTLDKETDKYTKLFKKGEITIEQYEKKLKDGQKELDKNKEKLEDGKAKIKDLKERLGSDEKIKEMYDAVKETEDMIADFDKLIKEKGADDPAVTTAARTLGLYIVTHEDTFKKAFDEAQDPQVLSNLEELEKKYPEISFEKAIAAVKAIQGYSYDDFIDDAWSMALSGDIASYEKMRSIAIACCDAVKSLVEQLWAAEEKIADGEKEIASYQKKIDDGRKELNKRKKQLKDGKAEFASKKADAESKIKAGWAEYYSEKTKYEGKLAEAVELLAVNREKAEKKLAEAKKSVNNIRKCEYIVIDRKGNAGYVDMDTNTAAIESMGVVFGILFTLITAIVCFSTLVIIIDEQKTLVGTTKAFGFHKKEILGKYLLFGTSAAAVGDLLAVTISILLADFIQMMYEASGLYPIGVSKSIILPLPTILFSLLIIAVTVLASVIACLDILRSPASMLMNGAVLKREKKKKKERTERKSSTGKTLYSRLIIRNMIQDRARVIITIAIIGFSCMLIGLGISIKAAYDGMMDMEETVVNRYDLRMDMNKDVSGDDEAELVAVLEKNDADFMPATYSKTLYKWNGRLDGVTLICANPERVSEFYGITDITGKDVELPEDGILIQKRMHESYDMMEGDMLPVLDDSLREHDAEIKGTFINYVGRTVVCSPAAYKSIFGDVNKANCYFIKLNGADINAVEDELLKVSDDISFSGKDDFRVKFESASMLFLILVIVTTSIAILMSFMILTNLANIYLMRKKTELTVMRVNGFTVRECKGYLTQESVLTTAGGIILGVLLGAVITPAVITVLQQPDLEFVKSFNVAAWAIAIGLEALFAFIINSFVYRKVRDLNLRDIA